jgi:hypothetical protein
MTADQAQRLRRVLNGGLDGPRKVKVLKTPRKWTSTGWQVNPKYSNGLRLLTLIGVGAGSAWAMFDFAGQEEQSDEVVRQAKLIRQESDPLVRKADTIIWLLGPVKTYLSNFIPEEESLNLAIGAMVYKTLVEIE